MNSFITKKPMTFTSMELKDNFFIAIYTNHVKDYCDEQFFQRVLELKGKNYLGVVDNSEKEFYVKRLRKLIPTAAIERIDVAKEPKISRFQRNVTDSVNHLRDQFLKLGKKYFLILESDVLAPVDLLEKFRNSIQEIEKYEASMIEMGEWNGKKWGAIGGIYYKGFHDYELKGLQQTNHVLSGCTVYSKELIEKHPFRYDPENLKNFPDAWISVDANKDFTLWNDHNIVCEHLHNKHGLRMSRGI